MPAGSTYTSITTTTLGSTTTTYTFSSIPSTYTDLIIIVNSLGTSSSGIDVQFNGDTANNYSWTLLSGDGTSATSTRVLNTGALNLGVTHSASPSTNIIQVMNYSNTTTYKTAFARINSATLGFTSFRLGTWRNTAAINSISLTGGSFAAGTTLTLYGITAA